MTPVRLIDGALVGRLLDMPSCIAAMRQALALVSRGSAVQPLRTALFTEDRGGLLGLMPGAVADPPAFGIKVVSVFPGNFAAGKPTHQGFVLLFDPADGRPLAILDAHAVTAVRTAAASAVATDLLAPAGAVHLALLGYGDQAASHLAALSQVRRIDRVTVWGRNPDRAAAFAQAHQGDRPIAVASSAEAAVAAADIVCTLTASPDPVLFGRWLRPGMHINAVGSSLPDFAELDAEAVARCRLFTDYRASAETLCGELRRAVAAGAVGADHLLGEIGAVANGTLPGRITGDDITCFKSLGMAAEDLVAASLVYNRAVDAGCGVVVPM